MNLPKIPKVDPYYPSMFGAMVGTIGLLFGLQWAYGTYTAVSHVNAQDVSAGEDVRALKDGQRQALHNGRLPIDQAMSRLAQGDRGAIALISPRASTDPGPAAGWMHHPDYVAPPEPLPPEPMPELEDIPLDGAATGEGVIGEEAAAPGAAAPTPVVPPAATPMATAVRAFRAPPATGMTPLRMAQPAPAPPTPPTDP